MKILITAGGTTEKIDQVRAITNHSTGRLGQALADYLVQIRSYKSLYWSVFSVSVLVS